MSQIFRSIGIEKASVIAVVEGLMTAIKDNLAHGENVYLRGFCIFQIKRRTEKLARNISKNTIVVVPALNIPTFKPAEAFKEEVAKV